MYSMPGKPVKSFEPTEEGMTIFRLNDFLEMKEFEELRKKYADRLGICLILLMIL